MSNTENQLVPLLREAMQSRDVDPAKMSALLQVRRDWEADEAKKKFNEAITEFQACAPIIPKDDEAYGKKYARIDRIWRTVGKLITKLGLSITWQVCEMRNGVCHIEGTLRHKAGHGERLVQDIPMPDLLKGQNAAQQMGSAETYAKRYAMCGALGIITGDDDDGTAAGTCYISAEQAQTIDLLLSGIRASCDFKEDAFWSWLGLSDQSKRSPLLIQSSRYDDVVAMLNRKLGKEGAK